MGVSSIEMLLKVSQGTMAPKERKTPRSRLRSPAIQRPERGGHVATGQLQLLPLLEVREDGARAGNVK